jgi:hypothetical protein
MLRGPKVYLALPLTPAQFPKGRSDSLTSHLLRKCPNVTQDDREWVFNQIQQTPDKTGFKTSQPPSSLSHGIVQDNAQSEVLEAPLHNFQQQSALDTLAEVSRHHLDYSSQRGFADLFSDPRVEPINEQAIIQQLRDGAGVGNSVTTAESESIYLFTSDPEPHQPQQTSEFISTSALAASPLVQTASAANQQLEQARTNQIALTQNGSFVDPQLDEMGAPVRSHEDNNGKIAQNAHALAWDSAQFGKSTFGNLSMSPNDIPGFRVVQKTAKQKGRSHFNDTRRKEVQEIRKRGACLRCRMLKKPCSGETPCSTCRTVESARLWKGKCLRTRVADEFSLWSTSLFYTRAQIEIPAAIHRLEQQALPGRIEARFFTSSPICVSFPVKAYTAAGVDPDLRNVLRDDVDGPQNVLLLDEGDSVSDKLEAYVSRTIEALIHDDRSDFTRTTLLRALALIEAEEADQTARINEPSDYKSPRSCYSLQNQLLKNVVELWVYTRLLASPHTYTLQLSYNAADMPRLQPEEIDWSNSERAERTGNIPTSSTSHQLIRAQLMAAIESRCSKLSKTVMNELERRLLQRQQVSRFATFLSAVILLNAVELMTGLYRPFDNGGLSTDNAYGSLPGKENISGSGDHSKLPSIATAAWGDMSYHATDQPYVWPIDAPPSTLWSQGPHFADLLTMLLRMRALPPKTCQTSDGTLAALQDYALPVHVNGRPVREQIDEQTKTAAEWLDPLKLKVSELIQKRDGPLPGRDDGVEEWEMRFVAKVLLPERIR